MISTSTWWNWVEAKRPTGVKNLELADLAAQVWLSAWSTRRRSITGLRIRCTGRISLRWCCKGRRLTWLSRHHRPWIHRCSHHLARIDRLLAWLAGVRITSVRPIRLVRHTTIAIGTPDPSEQHQSYCEQRHTPQRQGFF